MQSPKTKDMDVAYKREKGRWTSSYLPMLQNIGQDLGIESQHQIMLQLGYD